MDNINSPSHYTHSRIEPIRVIEAWGLPMHLGNALKYIARNGVKTGAQWHEDLCKSVWYIVRYLLYHANQQERHAIRSWWMGLKAEVDKWLTEFGDE